MNRDRIKFTTKDGKEVEGDILLTFDDNMTNNCYVIYTDYSTTEEDELQIYASIYEPDDEMIALKPITDEEDWKLVNLVINHVKEKLKIDDKNHL